MKAAVHRVLTLLYVALLRLWSWRLGSRPYEVVAVLGQSNAVGYGRGWRPLSLHVPSRRVAQFTRGRVLPAVEPLGHPVIRWQGVGSMVAWARTQGRPILLVPVAVGDVGFVPAKGYGWARDEPVAQSLYDLAVKQIATAVSLHPESRLAMVVWRHGERDAALGMDADDYERHLCDLLDGLTERFGNFGTVTVGMCPVWTDARPETAGVAKALQRVGEERGQHVGGPALSNPGERFHYSAAGQLAIAALTPGAPR